MMSMDGQKMKFLILKGGYAKCIDLSEDKEPDIFNAIKKGAPLENISLKMVQMSQITWMVQKHKIRVLVIQLLYQ